MMTNVAGAVIAPTDTPIAPQTVYRIRAQFWARSMAAPLTS